MRKTAQLSGGDFEWGTVPRKRIGYRNTIEPTVFERIVKRIAAFLLFLAHMVIALYILFTS